MNGQWIGTYTGTNSGSIVINLDERRDGYEGFAYLFDRNRGLPDLAAHIELSGKSKTYKTRTDKITAINPLTRLMEPWDSVKNHYPSNIIIPQFADISISATKNTLSLSWKTSVGTNGNCTLKRKAARGASQFPTERMTWDDFKKCVSDFEGRRFLFRGQNGGWKLRTSYHRRERADLNLFVNEDIQALHRNLSARTKHFFNLYTGQENGAFFNLVQHHGYPTPLLDWSFSPYVAAFFAFRGITSKDSEKSKENDRVKIFIFNQADWTKDFEQSQNFLFCPLHLSVHEFVAIENERMIPQQAASTVTNIDDIEAYIELNEKNRNKKYLRIISLSKADRNRVMHELSFMGITAGSLFPGLDGACEELKERHFSF